MESLALVSIVVSSSWCWFCLHTAWYRSDFSSQPRLIRLARENSRPIGLMLENITALIRRSYWCGRCTILQTYIGLQQAREQQRVTLHHDFVCVHARLYCCQSRAEVNQGIAYVYCQRHMTKLCQRSRLRLRDGSFHPQASPTFRTFPVFLNALIGFIFQFFVYFLYWLFAVD